MGLTNHTGPTSHHITSLVINVLGVDGHTDMHIYRCINKNDFKKPGVHSLWLRAPGLKSKCKSMIYTEVGTTNFHCLDGQLKVADGKRTNRHYVSDNQQNKSGIQIGDLNKNLTNGKSHAHMVHRYTVFLLVKDYAISLPIYLLHKVKMIKHAYVEYLFQSM